MGCCPDFCPETGRQLNMKCTCGATVPIGSRSSICHGCLTSPYDEFGNYDPSFEDDYYPEDEDWE
jgi:hypothetical protein